MLIGVLSYNEVYKVIRVKVIRVTDLKSQIYSNLQPLTCKAQIGEVVGFEILNKLAKRNFGRCPEMGVLNFPSIKGPLSPFMATTLIQV